jgi:hypothetical protein
MTNKISQYVGYYAQNKDTLLQLTTWMAFDGILLKEINRPFNYMKFTAFNAVTDTPHIPIFLKG